MNNPLKVDMEIELLRFKDGVGPIDKSRRAGHISEDTAHQVKNEVAHIYAERIARLINQGRLQTYD